MYGHGLRALAPPPPSPLPATTSEPDDGIHRSEVGHLRILQVLRALQPLVGLVVALHGLRRMRPAVEDELDLQR